MDTASSPSVAAPAAPEQAPNEAASESQESGASQDVPEWKRIKHKVPIKGDDGNEVEVEYDELVKNYALNKTISQRGQEAAKIQKEAKAQLDAFQRDLDACKGNPKLLFELAQSIGVPKDQLKAIAEEMVWEEIQWERMTDEQKEAAVAKRERDELKKEKEAREAKAKEEEDAELEAQLGMEIQESVMSAVKLSGMKPTPRLIARIAELIQSSLNTQDTLPSPEVIAKKVRDWYHQDHSELYGSDDVTVEELIQAGLLPDKLLTKVQKYLLDKASKNVPSFGSSRQATSPKGQPKAKQKVGIDDFFRKLGS